MKPEEFKVGVEFIYPGIGDLKNLSNLSVGKKDKVTKINPMGKNSYGKDFGKTQDGGDLIVSRENSYYGFSNTSQYAKACILVN
jgi:hypothetical protein